MSDITYEELIHEDLVIGNKANRWSDITYEELIQSSLTNSTIESVSRRTLPMRN